MIDVNAVNTRLEQVREAGLSLYHCCFLCPGYIRETNAGGWYIGAKHHPSLRAAYHVLQVSSRTYKRTLFTYIEV